MSIASTHKATWYRTCGYSTSPRVRIWLRPAASFISAQRIIKVKSTPVCRGSGAWYKYFRGDFNTRRHFQNTEINTTRHSRQGAVSFKANRLRRPLQPGPQAVLNCRRGYILWNQVCSNQLEEGCRAWASAVAQGRREIGLTRLLVETLGIC